MLTFDNRNAPLVIVAYKGAEFILQGAEQDWYKEQAYLAQAEEITRNGS